MSRNQNPFVELAERARGGDESARQQYQQRLKPMLVFVVRRVLTSGSTGSAVDEEIVAEARRQGLRPNTGVAALADAEAFYRAVAGHLYHWYLARLGLASPRFANAETVRA